MSKLHTQASAIIPAPPAAVHTILTDYHNHHPQILPTQYFTRLEVEQGGHGAGTVFRLTGQLMGQERQFHMDVTEPEPGRTIVEADRLSDLVTTFTIQPAPDPRHTNLTIATDWTPAGGLAGLLERLFTPGLLRRIYNKELNQLIEYVQTAGSTFIPTS